MSSFWSRPYGVTACPFIYAMQEGTPFFPLKAPIWAAAPGQGSIPARQRNARITAQPE